MDTKAASKKSETTRPAIHRTPNASIDDDVKLSDAANDALESFRRYAVQRPDVVALWAFGAGFILGWRLKPW